MTDPQAKLETFLAAYCDNVREGLDLRWQAYAPEIFENEISDTIAGLAARQASLAIEFARNPGAWTHHLAPLVMRAMIDVHITLAWILGDPGPRSKDYIRYGLGQEKLFLEFLKQERDQIPEGEFDGSIDDVIEGRRAWLTSQLAEWAIDINLGSWSGKSARDMALEADLESLYKFAYMPFSGAAHSMWHFVGVFNVVPCENPLHKHHRLPIVRDAEPEPDYLYRSSKYVSRTYRLLSEKLGLAVDLPLPVEWFLAHHPFGQRGAEVPPTEGDGDVPA
jgi:hypothetical protein